VRLLFLNDPGDSFLHIANGRDNLMTIRSLVCCRFLTKEFNDGNVGPEAIEVAGALDALTALAASVGVVTGVIAVNIR
jgi:hypothetical protein